MPFEQAREQISNRVFTDKRKAEFQKYLEKLRAQAIIEWKNDDVKKAYDSGRRSSRAAAALPAPMIRARCGRAQWFAIWTRSRHEQVVREQLERKHIDAFLPTITRWSRWKDRKKKIDWPLFPGYCFARFDPADSLPILKCTGVVNIVSFEGKPAPIPDVELESIRLLVGSELQYDPCPLIHEGQMVEVVHGPLKGVVGRLMRKDAPSARLVLSVDLIGQAVSVEVDAADVKPYSRIARKTPAPSSETLVCPEADFGLRQTPDRPDFPRKPAVSSPGTGSPIALAQLGLHGEPVSH